MDGNNNNDDLLAQELKFAQAGLEAAQKLRERNKATGVATETSTSPSAVATATRPPPELLQTADDILPNDDEEGEDEDEAQNIRDVDGNVGPNAQLDAPEDYYDELEDVKDLGFARGIKLPEPVGMRAMNDLTMSDIRQSAMLAQLRKREANFLDTVRSLNITSLRLHAQEFGRTPVPPNTECEIHDWLGSRKNSNSPNILKIPMTGSLRFLETEEERAMFHNLDAKPYKDKLEDELPEWAKERLKKLDIWLNKVNNVLNEEKTVQEKRVQEEKLALDINEFVGWTYLYRYMNYENVAKSVNELVNYLMPQGVFQSEIDKSEGEEGPENVDIRNKFSWFEKRREFLEELDERMPSSRAMKKMEKESESLDKQWSLMSTALQMLGTADNDQRQKEIMNVLSFTWNYMFLLLFYRQIIVHEFFMFCVWKKLKAPILEAVDINTQRTINTEESEDDIMHTYWGSILNKFNLFRDLLMGAKDPFTEHFQRYMTLSHERIKISHERNMKRSEDVVFDTVTSDERSGIQKNSAEFASINDVLQKKIFNNIPKNKDNELKEVIPQRGGLISDLLNFAQKGQERITDFFQTA